MDEEDLNQRIKNELNKQFKKVDDDILSYLLSIRDSKILL